MAKKKQKPGCFSQILAILLIIVVIRWLIKLFANHPIAVVLIAVAVVGIIVLLCIANTGKTGQIPNISTIDVGEVDGMDGHEFEYWCAALLRKCGFSNVEVTPGSNDHGVDVTAEKDGISYAIQCKCYSSSLGNAPVQEVAAGKAMYNCQVGIVMTNSYFTDGARQLADANNILLWDRDKLQKMLDQEQSFTG